MKLKDLDSRQLKKVITDANVALDSRQRVDKALIEVHRISKKYKLSKDELKTILVSIQSSKAVLPNKQKSVRAKVESKYRSEDGKKVWTGRGRTPRWVVEICQSNSLSVEDFKADPRFLIQKSSISVKAAKRG